MKKRCDMCKFAEKIDCSEPNVYFCHRYPPSGHYIYKEYPPVVPQTYGEWWCDEWCAKSKECKKPSHNTQRMKRHRLQ